MNRVFAIVLGLLAASAANAQISTFDNNNEDWTANGDPTNNVPAWFASGGNPGGHIRVTDSSLGGTWYFVAPSKYLGNRCGAYGKYLRWDQFTSDTTTQQLYGGRPDLILFSSGGIQLIFDNAYNPSLGWTHFDVLLAEGSGWHFGSLAGPEPTAAEFQAALANVTGLHIRGEYRAQSDFGGLDNVILEGDTSFDLDGDNSSGAQRNDFQADSICEGPSPVADVDAVILSDYKIDSLTIDLFAAPDIGFENLLLNGTLPATVGLLQSGPRLVLQNLGNAAPADFLAALQVVLYQNNAPAPLRGVRTAQVRLWNACGVAASAFAKIPYFPAGFPGLDNDTTFCFGAPALDLRTVLGGKPSPDGVWLPSLAGGGNDFDPTHDPTGTYIYILYGVGSCPNDSAQVLVSVAMPPELGSDTSLCSGEVYLLEAPTDGFSIWQWNTGEQSPRIRVQEPGLYEVTVANEFCAFTDSLRVGFFNCEECKVFAPNVLAPEKNSPNDRFRLFLSCPVITFRLDVFDRWGQQIFKSYDPEIGWDGRFREQAALPGVYFWHMEMTIELNGIPVLRRAAGDITLLR